MISCYCAVYGRVRLLEEAIESFHRQTWKGEKELVIVNDHRGQELRYEHPEVTIINVPRRFHSLGEKWNAAISLCKGDLLTPWDDDDIHLPWFLETYVDRLGASFYFRPIGAWLWQAGGQPLLAFNAPYHSQCIFSRNCFDLIQGYPVGRHVPEDTTFEQNRIMRGVPSVNCLMSIREYAYIYRWKWDWNNSDGWTGDPARNDKDVPTGRIDLVPTWRKDYEAIIRKSWSRPGFIDPTQLLGNQQNVEVLCGKGRDHCREQQAEVVTSDDRQVEIV